MDKKNLLFHCEDIMMQFPATLALQGVNMDIYPGEVIGLVGENGAGKSTLLKIIMGVQKQTKGSMKMNGKPYAPKNPREANLNGVGMVFQDQLLITNLTVGQNIFFGKEKDYAMGPLINYSKLYAGTQRVFDSIGIKNVKPNEKISNLDFATRQMVEIAKIIQGVSTYQGKSLVLLDEPTSILNKKEIKKLFFEIRHLKSEGHAVIFVSHRLSEVIEISDRIYVFKDGQQVGVLNKDEIDEDVLYKKMVGHMSSGEYYKENRQKMIGDKVVYEVKNLSLFGSFKDVSFKLHNSEVLGIYGLIGSGKEDLSEVIAGIEAPSRGEMFIEGRRIKPVAPWAAVDNGIVSIPQERNKEGILGSLSIYENITISNLSNVANKYGVISKNQQVNKSNWWIKDLNIKCPNCYTDIDSLSGGNAQKVVFARVLNSNAKILILNHPTRGIDVEAKEEIYSLIRDATDRGIAIILLGDTLDECIGLSSRIITLKDGIVTHEFICDVGSKPDQLEVLKYVM